MEKELLENLELEEIEIEYDQVYKKKKRRTVKKGVFIFLIFILIVAICLFVMFSNTFKLKTVNISGNHFLTDEEIIEYGNISVNSSVVVNYLTEIELNIEGHEIVKNAKVNYDGFNTLTIVIEEEKVLFSTIGGVYLSSGFFIETETFSPVVDFENFADVEKKYEVLKELARLFEESPEVYEFISQISFAPDSVTEDRIMFVMRDTNIVYVSTDQISSKMSKYFDVIDLIFTDYGEIYGVLSFDKGGEFKPY